MVIQRWQSVFFLIAAITMAVFTFSSFAVYTDEVTKASVDVTTSESTVYLVLNALVAILCVISIFLFKNLKLQKTVAKISALLVVCSIVCAILLTYGPTALHDGAALVWTGGFSLLVGALLMIICAWRGVKRDQKILSSYDRIR